MNHVTFWNDLEKNTTYIQLLDYLIILVPEHLQKERKKDRKERKKEKKEERKRKKKEEERKKERKKKERKKERERKNKERKKRSMYHLLSSKLLICLFWKVYRK